MKIIYLKNYLKNYFINTKFLSIFLLYPLKNKDWNKIDYTTSHFHKGKDYHLKFNKFPGRKIIWDLEKKTINQFIARWKKDNHLDFASGTGRISKLLEKKFKNQYLLDSSFKMLKYAKSILKNSIIINKDFTKIKSLNKKFDIVTAFRFFPNAEPKLRKKAFKFISSHLTEDGIFIFNNHRNFWSIPYFFKRLTFRSDGFGMTHGEVIILLNSFNLKIVDYQSIGILTEKEKGFFLCWKIIKKIEFFIFKKFGPHKLGYDIIYKVKKC